MVQAILFDSDGVLVDSERLYFDATRSAFEAEGGSLSCAQWARWYLSEGKQSRHIAELIGISSSRIERAIARRDELFWQHVDQGVPLLPGVTETLNNLARRFRLAVVTGAYRAHYDRVHATTGLAGLFEVVVTRDESEYPKPHPQAYLTAMDRLALKPDECLAIEDSPRGATAAVAAGIRCFIIPTHLTDTTLCPADCVILENMTMLADILEPEGRLHENTAETI